MLNMKKSWLFVFGILILSSFVFAESLVGSGSAQVSFGASAGASCSSGSNFAYWVSSSNETIFNSSRNVGNCSKYPYTSSDGSLGCCPTGYSCNPSSGQCYIGSQTGCAQYNTSQDCRQDVNGVADVSFESRNSSYNGICKSSVNYNSPYSGASCLNFSVCSCYWNSTLSKCGSQINYSSFCSGSPSVSKTCNWVESSTENKCNTEGKIIVTYVAGGDALGTVLNNGVKCENIQTTYPCSASVKLPFFDGFSFMLSLLAIVGIYFVASRKVDK